MLESGQSDTVSAGLLEPIQRIEISEATYARIRKMIVLGNLLPGAKLDLDFLADSLQVGRTTVANALQRLQLEDLVHVVPRRGTFVTRFTAQQVRDIYEVRMCIESWAAGKAAKDVSDEQIAELNRLLDEFVPFFQDAEQLDYAAFAWKNRSFHTYLVGLSRNEKMLSMYEGLPIDLLGYRVSHMRELSGSIGQPVSLEPLAPAEEDHEEHLLIVGALETREPARVEQVVRAHLERALQHHMHVLTVLGRA